MKKIVFVKEEETVDFDSIDADMPVFVKENGKLIGMIIHESESVGYKNNGFIIRFSDGPGATGHHRTLKDCIGSCSGLAYEFYVDI